ncbi:hypothetical protein GCM10015535_03810 [Streptomyces gelaticus]|uniref:Uncharacterized protein n=1 Tax=Streptomyces gelaticus TaxID=285446 RepID=A0ABQ2VRH8_9ACTN|nr:hypothetical protein GCM10015535_03810 [Streptomyces gelaticus]
MRLMKRAGADVFALKRRANASLVKNAVNYFSAKGFAGCNRSGGVKWQGSSRHPVQTFIPRCETGCAAGYFNGRGAGVTEALASRGTSPERRGAECHP